MKGMDDGGNGEPYCVEHAELPPYVMRRTTLRLFDA